MGKRTSAADKKWQVRVGKMDLSASSRRNMQPSKLFAILVAGRHLDVVLPEVLLGEQAHVHEGQFIAAEGRR